MILLSLNREVDVVTCISENLVVVCILTCLDIETIVKSKAKFDQLPNLAFCIIKHILESAETT